MEVIPTVDQIIKIHQLAKLAKIQTSYHSAFGMDVEASFQGLVQVLNALGGPQLAPDMTNLDEVATALQARHWDTLSEPVIVAWEGKPVIIPVRMRGPVPAKKQSAKINLKLENGKTLQLDFDLSKFAVESEESLDGIPYFQKNLIIKKKLPFGYHEGRLTVGTKKHKFLVISSPWLAYAPKKGPERWLGVFAPLYAVRSKSSWGIGDFTDLKKLVDWSYRSGCNFVGCLPMLSIFNGKPVVEPSPYAPMSRLHWNETYVDPMAAEEWKICSEARGRMESETFRKQLHDLNARREVDYEAVTRLKRGVLEPMAELFFTNNRHKSVEFKKFLKLFPTVEDYAAFRATGEAQNAPWPKWPDRMKSGELRVGDFVERDKRYHLYVQWLAHQQLSKLAASSKKKGLGIYIDFPLSAHADGYDVWRERESFGQLASAGCPPDPAHVHGQDWGILPLNPQSIRYNGYRYFRRCLENHMRYAGMLRLDHVMCFYRLFWVPHGLGAKQGVYVRYNLEEFFALLTLESHRNHCVLIGEDLGTVPPEIREAMTEHQILRMYVQQRRLSTDIKAPLSPAPIGAICSLNTHDMPPFAAFWQGLDILDKMDLGYFGSDALPEKQKTRESQKAALVELLKSQKLIKSPHASLTEILRGVLLMTASDPVKVMQVNLEDVWLETLSQNVPGTWKERPNWKRRWRHSLEELDTLPGLKPLFQEIVKRRKARISAKVIKARLNANTG